MGYEDLLKKAYSEMPKQSEETGRFEVPRAVTSGSGNLTMIKNFYEIAKLLRREPKHLARFLLKELAAPGNLDSNKLTVQRKIGGSLIDEKINLYVKEYVLCKECSKPDTKMIKENKNIIIKCEACGAKKFIS